MPHGTQPPGDGGDLTTVRVKCILNPHPGDRRNGQTAPPCTRGDHSADWRWSMYAAPVTHPVVKFPTPGQSEAVKSPVVYGGGGGGGGEGRGYPGLAFERCTRRAVAKKEGARDRE